MGHACHHVEPVPALLGVSCEVNEWRELSYAGIALGTGGLQRGRMQSHVPPRPGTPVPGARVGSQRRARGAQVGVLARGGPQESLSQLVLVSSPAPGNTAARVQGVCACAAGKGHPA